MPLSDQQQLQIQNAAHLIAEADALLFAAGSGMGVDSGLADYGANAGFWQAYPVLARAKVEFSSVSTPHAFRAKPALAWGFYGHRLATYRATAPHPGFALLRQWGEQKEHGYGVFTSNVDGHFQKAGFDPERIQELHGSIHHMQCVKPCTDDIWSADGFVPDVDEDACSLRNAVPVCPHCGAVARPNILMFGDGNWVKQREQEQAAKLEAWLQTAKRLVVLEIGAGTKIASVRHFSQRVVQKFGGRLIRINPHESEMPSALDIGLALPAGQALHEIGAILARDGGARG